MSRTSFETLLEAGCHFGHLKRKWNPGSNWSKFVLDIVFSCLNVVYFLLNSS